MLIVKARSTGGAEDFSVGKGWHLTHDSEHVAFEFSSSDPSGTFQQEV